MIQNVYGNIKISIELQSKNYCNLGKDWYTNNFEVEMIAGEVAPNYCDVDDFVHSVINGKSMIIEEAVKTLFDHMRDEYEPKRLTVRSSVDDAAHSAVVVEIKDKTQD